MGFEGVKGLWGGVEAGLIPKSALWWVANWF